MHEQARSRILGSNDREILYTLPGIIRSCGTGRLASSVKDKCYLLVAGFRSYLVHAP